MEVERMNLFCFIHPLSSTFDCSPSVLTVCDRGIDPQDGVRSGTTNASDSISGTELLAKPLIEPLTSARPGSEGLPDSDVLGLGFMLIMIQGDHRSTVPSLSSDDFSLWSTTTFGATKELNFNGGPGKLPSLSAGSDPRAVYSSVTGWFPRKGHSDDRDDPRCLDGVCESYGRERSTVYRRIRNKYVSMSYGRADDLLFGSGFISLIFTEDQRVPELLKDLDCDKAHVKIRLGIA